VPDLPGKRKCGGYEALLIPRVIPCGRVASGVLRVTYTAEAPVPSLELSTEFARAASCRMLSADPEPEWTKNLAIDFVVMGCYS